MPLLSISTSAKISDKKNFLSKCSKLLANLTKKPENYVMVSLNENIPMYFGGNDDPCCYVDIKSIGSLNPSYMTKPICEFIFSTIEIPIDRIYVSFEDIDAKYWGWKSQTFG